MRLNYSRGFDLKFNSVLTSMPYAINRECDDSSRAISITFYKKAEEAAVVSLLQAYESGEGTLPADLPEVKNEIFRFNESVVTHNGISFLFFAKNTGLFKKCVEYWRGVIKEVGVGATKEFSCSDDAIAWLADNYSASRLVKYVQLSDVPGQLYTNCSSLISSVIRGDYDLNGAAVEYCSIVVYMLVHNYIHSHKCECYQDVKRVIQSVCLALFDTDSDLIEQQAYVEIINCFVRGDFND